MSLELNTVGHIADLVSLNIAYSRQTNELNRSAQEFDVRKKLAIASGQASPHKAVAAFLALISIENEREGRSPDLICESVKCVAAALPLNIDANMLERNLSRLERLGIILRGVDGSIRVLSLHLLARIADGE